MGFVISLRTPIKKILPTGGSSDYASPVSAMESVATCAGGSAVNRLTNEVREFDMGKHAVGDQIGQP